MHVRRPAKPKRAQNYRKATKANYPEKNKMKNKRIEQLI